MKLKHTSLADDTRQRNSLSNIFISYAPTDHTLIDKLHRSFRKRNLNAWSNSSDVSQAEIEARIDAADYFLSVLSPDYEEAKQYRRQLRYALTRHKRVLPLIHKNVELKAFPELNLSSPPLFFREKDNFKKSFTALLDKISSDLKLDAFISYSHQDSDFAQKLAAAFMKHQRKVWLDKR